MLSDNLSNLFKRVQIIAPPGTSVGYCSDCDMHPHEYRNAYQKELSRLNDTELILVYHLQKKKGRYFNLFIQAHWSAINKEMSRRGLGYKI
jgi:hypothetical protein